MENRILVSLQDLYESSIHLGEKVAHSGFKPDIVVVLCRGGSTVGVIVHEVLKKEGIDAEFVPLVTDKQDKSSTSWKHVKVKGDISQQVKGKNVLIVDDVFDTATTYLAVQHAFEKKVKDMRIATVHFKPDKSNFSPDYFAKSVPGEPWLVYPHEISDMTDGEYQRLFNT